MSEFDNLFGVHYLTKEISFGSVYSVPSNEQLDAHINDKQTEGKEMCPVCGDKVSGYHYGLLTCESCKGFFKRTVQNKKVYSCGENKKCPIDKSQRKRCPYCRYQKCLKVGMRLDAVRSDRMRGGRNKLGPMYKQDRARKQQLQAFRRATGFLKVVDPRRAIHSAVEKTLFGGASDWLHDGKSDPATGNCNLKIGELGAEATKWWPYASPQLILPSAEPSTLTTVVQISPTPTQDNVDCAVSVETIAGVQYTNTHSMGLQSSEGNHLASTAGISKFYRTGLHANVNGTDAQKREANQHLNITEFVETGLSTVHHDTFRCVSDVPEQLDEIRVGNPIDAKRGITTFVDLLDNHSHFMAVNQAQSLQTTNTLSANKHYRLHEHVQHNGKLRQDLCKSNSQTNIIEILSMCEINEKDIRARLLKKIDKSPEHGFAFICSVTNAMLLLLVEWAKSSLHFQELKTTDQMILLQKGWVDILVLDHIFRQIEYSNGFIVIPTGHCFAPDVYDGLINIYCLLKEEATILRSIMQRFLELTTKLRNLKMDRKEFICLKFLILFNTDASPESKTHLKKTQEIINMALCDYSSNRTLSNSGRVGQILYTLSEIRTLSLLCEDYFLRQHLKGNTPADTLLVEMLHAKRNITVI